MLLLFDFYVFSSLASSPSVISEIKNIYTSPSICQGGIEHMHQIYPRKDCQFLFQVIVQYLQVLNTNHSVIMVKSGHMGLMFTIF